MAIYATLISRIRIVFVLNSSVMSTANLNPSSSSPRVVFRKKNSAILNLYSIPENSHLICVLSASSRNDNKSTSLSIFDIVTGKETSAFRPPPAPITCATVAGNKIIAGTENGRIYAFSEKTGPKEPIFELRPEFVSECTSLSVNASGTLLASAVQFQASARQDEKSDSDEETAENGILFYDLRSNPPSLLGAYKESHSDNITCLSFHPTDSDLLCSGGDDGLANIFDLKQSNEDDALQFTFNCISSISKIGHWKSGSKSCLYALTDDEKLFGWTTGEGDELFSIEKVEALFPNTESEQLFLIDCFQANSLAGSFFVMATTADGILSASLMNEGRKTGAVVFDNLSVGHTDMIRALLWDDMSNLLFTGGDDGLVVCLDMSKYLSAAEEPVRRKRIRRS